MCDLRDPIDVELKKPRAAYSHHRMEIEKLTIALESKLARELIREVVNKVVPSIAERVVAGAVTSVEFDEAFRKLVATHTHIEPASCRICEVAALR